MESSKRMWGGRDFQSLGAAWEKALTPIVLSLMTGGASKPADEDHREREGV